MLSLARSASKSTRSPMGMYILAASVTMQTAPSISMPSSTSTSDAPASFCINSTESLKVSTWEVLIYILAFLEWGTFISARRFLIALTASIIMFICSSSAAKQRNFEY